MQWPRSGGPQDDPWLTATDRQELRYGARGRDAGSANGSGSSGRSAYDGAVIARARRAPRRACSVCVQDEVYDSTGRHPAAVVRVEICREPYVLRSCDHHLAQRRQTEPIDRVHVVDRFAHARSAIQGADRDGREAAHQIWPDRPVRLMRSQIGVRPL